MIKPLREAYENYERMRLEEETVAQSSPAETVSEPQKVLVESDRTNTGQGQWSPKMKMPVMGVSKEIRDMFHDKNEERRPSGKSRGQP